MVLIDASTDRLINLDPIRPRPGYPVIEPPDASYVTPAPYVPGTTVDMPEFWTTVPGYDNPAAMPIWGEPVRMLTSGGGWDVTEEARLLRKDDGVRLRSPHAYNDPTGRGEGWAEPPPQVSNQRWNMMLCRAMFRAGWTLAQVVAAMWAHRTAGGWYWRYRYAKDPRPEDHPLHFGRQLWATLVETETICGLPIGVVGDTGRREFVFDPKDQEMRKMVRWIRGRPPVSQNKIIAAKLVHPRLVRPYLGYMGGWGMIKPVTMIVPDRRGYQRRTKVWRVGNTALLFGAVGSQR